MVPFAYARVASIAAAAQPHATTALAGWILLAAA